MLRKITNEELTYIKPTISIRAGKATNFSRDYPSLCSVANEANHDSIILLKGSFLS